MCDCGPDNSINKYLNTDPYQIKLKMQLGKSAKCCCCLTFEIGFHIIGILSCIGIIASIIGTILGANNRKNWNNPWEAELIKLIL